MIHRIFFIRYFLRHIFWPEVLPHSALLCISDACMLFIKNAELFCGMLFSKKYQTVIKKREKRKIRKKPIFQLSHS